jgi:hypothetical protein
MLCGLIQLRITFEIVDQLHIWYYSADGAQPHARPLPPVEMTTQTRTNIHDLSGIRTHDPSIQAARAHDLDPTATNGRHKKFLL